MTRVVLLVLLLFSFSAFAQQQGLSFGLQYKPIIPVAYFGAADISKNSNDYDFVLSTKYGSSLGMVLRQKLNHTFSLESGLNYIQRNKALSVNNKNTTLKDSTTFSFRSYEIPMQLLAYVQVDDKWYLNAAFGASSNFMASDVFSDGEYAQDFYQNTFRDGKQYFALLANLGMEYRTLKYGYFYLGASLHRPWKRIAKIYPTIDNDSEKFNTDKNWYIYLNGNFISIDLRYFFNE